MNSDGSKDHGLFQISDKYWCVEGQVDGACGVDCKGTIPFHMTSVDEGNKVNWILCFQPFVITISRTIRYVQEEFFESQNKEQGTGLMPGNFEDHNGYEYERRLSCLIPFILSRTAWKQHCQNQNVQAYLANCKEQ